MKLSSYAKKPGIHDNTAWRMFQRGQMPGYQLPTGTVIVEEPVERTRPRPPKQQLVAVYTRVSSSENKKNLDTQAERLITYCHAQGWSFGKVVKECGSGINDQRPHSWRGLLFPDQPDCGGTQRPGIPLWSGLYPNAPA
jgi:putative resolvase